MNNLKPCPFCGGEAEIVLDIEYKGDNAIECQNCGVLLSVCDEDIEPLIEAWNRRADDGRAR